MTDIELINIEEAAHTTRLSARYLYQLARQGQLPSIRVGRRVRVRPADLDAFITEYLRPAVALTADSR